MIYGREDNMALPEKVERYFHTKIMGELKAELDAMTEFVNSLSPEDWKQIITKEEINSEEMEGKHYVVSRALYDYVRDNEKIQD